MKFPFFCKKYYLIKELEYKLWAYNQNLEQLNKENTSLKEKSLKIEDKISKVELRKNKIQQLLLQYDNFE